MSGTAKQVVFKSQILVLLSFASVLSACGLRVVDEEKGGEKQNALHG